MAALLNFVGTFLLFFRFPGDSRDSHGMFYWMGVNGGVIKLC
jgi:hypothetical protein